MGSISLMDPTTCMEGSRITNQGEICMRNINLLGWRVTWVHRFGILENLDNARMCTQLLVATYGIGMLIQIHCTVYATCPTDYYWITLWWHTTIYILKGQQFQSQWWGPKPDCCFLIFIFWKSNNFMSKYVASNLTVAFSSFFFMEEKIFVVHKSYGWE